MKDKLIKKAQNYYLLGLFAEKRNMNSESVSNYFKSLFALADLQIYLISTKIAKNHTERFELLKKHDEFLYNLLDGLFIIYRDTYTKEITDVRVKFVREKLNEAFEHTKVEKPTEKDL
jgi:hypothetical protein